MRNYKFFLITFGFLFVVQIAAANNIQVATFNELMDSHPSNGDTIQILDNLTSTSTIGSNFLDLNINFDGQNHYLDGENTYGGGVFK